jgi:hypothetical protein
MYGGRIHIATPEIHPLRPSIRADLDDRRATRLLRFMLFHAIIPYILRALKDEMRSCRYRCNSSRDP